MNFTGILNHYSIPALVIFYSSDTAPTFWILWELIFLPMKSSKDATIMHLTSEKAASKELGSCY